MNKDKSFEEIPYNRSEIIQEKLNIENKKRTSLFKWNGQFSPQFIEVLLDKYSKENYKVLDPFVGSGTVLYESGLKNLTAYGVEINGSAYNISKLYEWINFNYELRRNIIDSVEKLLKQNIDNKILTEKEIKNIFNRILFESNNTNEDRVIQLLTTYIILLDFNNKKLNYNIICDKWRKLKNILLNLPYSDKKIKVINADARKIPLRDNQIDLVVTSPPYINVYNYHQQYRKSTEFIGYDVLQIAKSEVGSNRKNRGNRFLTVVQYCIDIVLVLKELSRLCKNNSRIILVIGKESNIKRTKLYNSKIVFLLATKCIGMNLIAKQERFFKNRYGQMIYEDILHFKNNKIYNKTCQQLVIEAKKIAKFILEDTLVTADKQVVNYIKEAIRSIENVKSSQIFKDNCITKYDKI